MIHGGLYNCGLAISPPVARQWLKRFAFIIQTWGEILWIFIATLVNRGEYCRELTVAAAASLNEEARDTHTHKHTFSSLDRYVFSWSSGCSDSPFCNVPLSFCTHALHTYMYIYIYTCIYTHTHVSFLHDNVYTHTYIHIYIYTYIYIFRAGEITTFVREFNIKEQIFSL